MATPKTGAARRKLTEVDKLLLKLLKAQRRAEDALLAEQERERARVQA
jgi:hypothetical protein